MQPNESMTKNKGEEWMVRWCKCKWIVCFTWVFWTHHIQLHIFIASRFKSRLRSMHFSYCKNIKITILNRLRCFFFTSNWNIWCIFDCRLCLFFHKIFMIFACKYVPFFFIILHYLFSIWPMYFPFRLSKKKNDSTHHIRVLSAHWILVEQTCNLFILFRNGFFFAFCLP